MIERWNTAKIVVSWDCNLSCSYCCNELSHISGRFKPITRTEICHSTYTGYELTGGETLLPQNLRIIDELCCKYLTKQDKVYVYSNGVLIRDTHQAQLLRFLGVDGLNIGYRNIELQWDLLTYINSYLVPIRLWVKDTDLHEIPDNLELETRVWTVGECDEVKTDCYYLVD